MLKWQITALSVGASHGDKKCGAEDILIITVQVPDLSDSKMESLRSQIPENTEPSHPY